MALVMLPSDLPWWDSVKKQLKHISAINSPSELVQAMQKIYEMCNISLDPDDDTSDPNQFQGLLDFLENDTSPEERNNFFNKTLPNIVKRALMIKELRPRRGLHFSLQQQADVTEINYDFAAALLANAFFSTFPKRTEKTHPTLQNFNFAHFFTALPMSKSQKAKLKSVLYYFDWFEDNNNATAGNLRIFRQVMHSKEWLTIDDWLECTLELCPLIIKHEGKLERSEQENLHVCFSSPKIGGDVLNSGNNQESIFLTTMPELLILLLNVESLEDNEVLMVENARQLTRINDPKRKASLEKLDTARELSICCIDADDYTKLPIGQYEEDNVLRELNKCLVAFQQKKRPLGDDVSTTYTYTQRHKRLSPIGESVSSNQSENNLPLITQESCSTLDSLLSENSGNNNTTKNRLQILSPINTKRNPVHKDTSLVNNRRGRFIVLGSSGEYLPVTRRPLNESSSSEEDFHSAKSSLDESSEEENYHKRYSVDLDTQERRHSFAQRLKEALKRDMAAETESSNGEGEDEESSYAVGISVAGSKVADCDNIIKYRSRVKRGGSTGFALKEDSLDEAFLQDSLTRERQWIDRFQSKQGTLSKKSSDYSFSTDYSSELEEVYEQFSHWLENPILEVENGQKKQLEARDLAVVKFAGSLLKRTLSESFAGVPVPLTESACDSALDQNFRTKKNKIVLNAKSLSLELARQNHRLASQLKSENNKNPRAAWFITCVTEAIIQTLEDINVTVALPMSSSSKVSAIAKRPTTNGLRPVSTGNWGCGSSRKGDAQLKMVVQWLAASVAGVPKLIYHTHNHQQLVKLDTVCRILVDRKWTVKDLAEATLRYSNHVLRGRELSGTLFEDLIRIDLTK